MLQDLVLQIEKLPLFVGVGNLQHILASLSAFQIEVQIIFPWQWCRGNFHAIELADKQTSLLLCEGGRGIDYRHHVENSWVTYVSGNWNCLAMWLCYSW